jgi:hypothetical protein
MTPGLKQMKYQGLRKSNDYENEEEGQETIDKMNELNLDRNPTENTIRDKPQSAYAGGRNKQKKQVNRKPSRGKLES